MTPYERAIQELYANGLQRDKLRPLEIMKGFNLPHAPIIHVAGSNGKGSTCFKTAKCLEENGLRVGLYTSPHINSFCERISINGKTITEEEVVTYLAEAPPPLTYFEKVTWMALRYFHDKKVDWIVLETGIGGRNDPTNAFRSVVAAITTINLEHTELLGQTLAEIAAVKAGILKPGAIAVIGGDIPRILLAPWLTPKTIFCQTSDPTDIAETIITALGFKKTPGLQTLPPCRFEIIGQTVLDVAHNPASLARLTGRFALEFPNEKAEILFSLSKSRDPIECASPLLPIASHFHLVTPDNPRSLSFTLPFPSTTYPTIKDGLTAALAKGRVLATGSFYHLGEVRDSLLGTYNNRAIF